MFLTASKNITQVRNFDLCTEKCKKRRQKYFLVFNDAYGENWLHLQD